MSNIENSYNVFSDVFYKSLSTSVRDNILCSPISVHILLTLLFHGSQNQTSDEFKTVLNLFDSVPSKEELKSFISVLENIQNVKFIMSNALYLQENLKICPEFLLLSRDVYSCYISHLNFEDNVRAVNEINSWVQGATEKKIQQIINPGDVDEDTKIILLNAMYFKSNWKVQFDPKLTEQKLFHTSSTKSKMVPMMFKKHKYASGELSDLNANFIDIPYANSEMMMTVILPNEIDGLNDLQSKFEWNKLTNAPRLENTIYLSLPKFKLEKEIDLEDVLRKIGLNLMFTDDANFSSIADIPLKVSQIKQKIFIEVNEEGSEAGATTVVQMRLKRSLEIPREFKVDRPFMFSIWHRPSKISYFMGSIMDIETLRERDEL